MSTYQEMFDEKINELLEEYKENPEEFNPDKFSKNIKEFMETSMPKIASSLYETLHKAKDELYKEKNLNKRNFSQD